MAASGSAEGGGFEAPSPADFYQPLIGSGQWAFTRPMLLMIISIIFIAGFLIATTRKAAVVPGKGQWLTEQVYNFVRNSVAQDTIGSKEFIKYVPLLFSLFMLILVNNLFGIIPPFQYPTFSRVGFPIGLALLVYVIYHAIGIKRKGVAGYFKGLIPSGLPKGIYVLIIPLELITYFITRPVTLALRLFGNMFAGHMLLLLFILGGQYMVLEGGPGLKVAGIGSWLLAFVMTVFEALIEFLQAYIFTLLAATYIADSLSNEH
ncbi:F0F1 ATP synthase subunit A [Calidifontibacter sp. DB0510]|uniref:ATP synthase subunit a n=2 Tax=Metallococcus carri TaxID=1656884 RepID=A0A967B2V2_9MICO|nr:F0F1 ATP synthase subunit A [Metallococcus carri]NOP35999.1 F0F1 ATP synthase subunit A [Calidifontibacter sp. DB2511S]